MVFLWFSHENLSVDDQLIGWIPEPPAVTVAARQVDLETTHPNDFAILVEAGSHLDPRGSA